MRFIPFTLGYSFTSATSLSPLGEYSFSFVTLLANSTVLWTCTVQAPFNRTSMNNLRTFSIVKLHSFYTSFTGCCIFALDASSFIAREWETFPVIETIPMITFITIIIIRARTTAIDIATKIRNLDTGIGDTYSVSFLADLAHAGEKSSLAICRHNNPRDTSSIIS